MRQRVDFSANASAYDRRHGALLPPEVVQELAGIGGLEPCARVLDVGAGTGRVSIAFAAAGYQVTALDPALPMLHELHGKAAELRIRLVAGEGARLPFAGGRFDAVVFARVLYLMHDWKAILREAHGVLRPGGCLFHEWGNGHAGEAWVQIREKLRALFQAAGVETPFHPGARSEADVDAALIEMGFVRCGELPIGPGPEMKLRDFIGRIAAGEFSYVWNVPADVRDSCISMLNQWCQETFDVEQSFPIPREIAWTIYRKPGR